MLESLEWLPAALVSKLFAYVKKNYRLTNGLLAYFLSPATEDLDLSFCTLTRDAAELVVASCPRIRRVSLR